MATLEERAFIWERKLLEAGCSRSHCNGNYTGYLQGATEQKAIDIEKATEWLKHHSLLNSIGIESFQKAMEE